MLEIFRIKNRLVTRRPRCCTLPYRSLPSHSSRKTLKRIDEFERKRLKNNIKQNDDDIHIVLITENELNTESVEKEIRI